PYSRTDLERLFAESIWRKAEGLVMDGAVLDVNVERDGKSITGRVRGQRRNPYLTRIKIANGRGGRVRLSSTCTCLVYSESEHAAATLLGLLDETAARDPEDGTVAIEPELEGWIAAVNGANRSDQAPASSDVVLYLLEPAQRSWREGGLAQPICVSTVRAKRMRSNIYGREHPVAIANLVGDAIPPYVGLDDQVIGRMLGGANVPGRRLAGLADSVLLEHMVATGRCHWRNAQGDALRMIESRRGHFSWKFDGEGQQRIVCELDDDSEETIIVGLGEPWFIDTRNATCGRVDTGLSQSVAGRLVDAPPVPPAAATIVRQRLQQSGDKLPLPEPLRQRERLEVVPVPVLYLHCPSVTVVRGTGWRREESEIDLPLARLSFNYAGAVVGWQNGRTELNHVADNRLLIISRDALNEVQAVERLNALGLQPLGPTGLGRFAAEDVRQDFTFEEDDDDDVSVRWVEFNQIDLPGLEKDGWQIEISESYPYQVVRDPPPWDIEISDSGTGWFELDLGIEIDGERVPLLPVLLDLFERAPEDMTPAALDSYGEELVYGTLPDGRLLPIPAARLKAMLEALYEQFSRGKKLDEDGRLRLRSADVSRLAIMDSSLTEDDVRWHGGDKLLELSRRLANPDGIAEVTPPGSLQATLRPYQLQGVSWLQFLSETGFSGVLADDMGLGKTLQTLTHLLALKETGRLDKPALVVAPTSLIPTWRNEARRFAPKLQILVLHGNSRGHLYKKLDNAEIILTSYALMLRDRDELIKRSYRVVILDEAQAIKNPTTKLAKVACELEADYRLALSGTPMENHLGELWSVFHYLMPGFLGEREFFRRTFRNPIEKDADADRQALLASRVRPFLMRRTKEQVASELPPKSEFVREIELSDEQRDLYESVRLAMHTRIRDEIKERGLARSNIAILEALLKLRQICCDPRLLKGDDGEKGSAGPGADVSSAKFDLLLSMLEGMVQNGRRVIIFSQFVEMLELVEAGLKQHKLGYTMLTGRTRDRETPVKRFQDGEVPIFLISLKAGGTGLTLTRADTVIHYDPWWNPAVEAQATDRAHRIGQDKQVFVYKLVASGTVEEKMLELQERKKALVQGIMGGVKSSLSFTEEDVEALFAPLPG
ncbi:MAG: DEAD/DEAH box helicase, partial [Geminicoccaceae bacterium]|nr:DEAD/DEAH box helicase [Geminicoccaceae bacterium]